MSSKHTSHWLYLSREVYTADLQEGLFLYHTKTGEHAFVSDPEITQLIRETRKPSNLGVIAVNYHELQESHSFDILQRLLSTHMLGLVPWDGQQKPINLLPILNLQKDIDKAQAMGEVTLALDNIFSYLTRLILVLDIDATRSRSLPLSLLSRRWVVPNQSSRMTSDLLDKIISDLRGDPSCSITMLSSGSLDAEIVHSLCHVINQYGRPIHLVLPISSGASRLGANWDIADLPKGTKLTYLVDDEGASDLIDTATLGVSDQVRLAVLIDDERHLDVLESLHTEELSTTIIPIYNGTNRDFFEKNLFIEEDDLFCEPISMRRIFCNQKLNTNNFGTLICFPDGTCRANALAPDLGSLRSQSLLELVHHELLHNTAWRKTRDESPCDRCCYRYLCPPPSNYERLLHQSNLCHITQ